MYSAPATPYGRAPTARMPYGRAPTAQSKGYLYLWLHMACKSMCEAVVEGMGGVWDRCDRQGNWVTATLEAVVAWNTPKPYHPAAVAFIKSVARPLGS